MMSWTVVGKGPNFSRFAEYPPEESIGLNHVWRYTPKDQKLTVLHAFDLDVVEELDAAALQKFEFLWLPDTLNRCIRVGRSGRVIHQRDVVRTSRRLAENPLIAQLLTEGRVFVYPRGSTTSEIGGFPVRVGAFSGSTVIALLASLGVKTLRLAGIDGGSSYANAFADLEATTKLNGGQDSFSSQLQEIANIRRAMGLELTDLGAQALRIFVGTTQGQHLPFEVLKYSIDRRSSRSVCVFPLDEAIAAEGIDLGDLLEVDSGGTPFSYQRYLIPALCQYSGSAIYLDSDMQLFDDIGVLHSMLPGTGCANAALSDDSWNREPQLSVLVIRCDRAPWSIESLKEAAKSSGYSAFRSEGPTPTLLERSVPFTWNSLEHYSSRETKLLHYTDMSTQPWLSPLNPLSHLWIRELFCAIDDGVVSEGDVDNEVNAGHVRPGIISQIQLRLEDPLSLPRPLIEKDLSFLPPHALMGFPGVARIAGIGNQLPSSRELLMRRFLGKSRLILMKPVFLKPAKYVAVQLRKTFRLLKILLTR